MVKYSKIEINEQKQTTHKNSSTMWSETLGLLHKSMHNYRATRLSGLLLQFWRAREGRTFSNKECVQGAAIPLRIYPAGIFLGC